MTFLGLIYLSGTQRSLDERDAPKNNSNFLLSVPFSTTDRDQDRVYCTNVRTEETCDLRLLTDPN